MEEGGNRHTQHIAWSSICTKHLRIVQGISQPNQQTSSTLEARNWVLRGNLKALCHALDSQSSESISVDLAGLASMAAEHAVLEHLQAGDGQALAASICAPILRALVGPGSSSAGIEEDRDQEEVEQAAAELRLIGALSPACEQGRDAVTATDIEVLPAAMGRDRRIVGSKVSLQL